MWYLLSILGAIADATYWALIKKYIKDVSHVTIAAWVFLYTSSLLLVVSLIKGMPEVGPMFFPALAVTGTLNIFAALLYYKALEITDLSLSVPMISFSPIFLIFTSFVILRELPTSLGVVGIVLIVFGSYILNSTRGQAGFLAPLKNMLRNRGILYMLIVSFSFSITANFDKIVVQNSDPIFGSSMIFYFIGFVFFVLAMKKEGGTNQFLRRHSFKYLLAALALGISIASINIAYSMQIVPYVISVKRLSIVFTVLFGGIALKERNLFVRLVGACIMLGGVVLIIVF